MKKIKSISILTTLSCLSLFANGGPNVDEQVNPNSMPTEGKLLIEQIEKQKAEQEAVSLTKLADYLQVGQQALCYIDTEALAEHTISAFPQENIIKLEDGTQWSFGENAIRDVRRNWKIGHLIRMTPRPDDRERPYMLENLSINRAVNVSIAGGPVEFGPMSNWITGMDPNLGQVYLKSGNGMSHSWIIDSAYIPILKEWAANNHVVIINYNKSWGQKYFPLIFPSPDYVLLNINHMHNVPAKPL